MSASLVVALDLPDLSRALSLVDRLEGVDCWFKVGLELFIAEGPGVVAELKDRGRNVFLDLKFLDIPNTVRGAVRSAAALGADMLTLHLSGGPEMAAAAVAGRDDGAVDGPGPLLVGVTVLTSQASGGMPGTGEGADGLGSLVLDLAQRAKAWYLDGVVCSGLEVGTVKGLLKRDFVCVTPGIRLGGDSGVRADDQRRVTTPAQAVASGSDYLVVGRPVTGADDPARAAARILDEMRGAAVRVRSRGSEDG